MADTVLPRSVSRRSFLRLTGGSLVGLGLAGAITGCGADDAGSGTKELRAAWFGGDDRHKRTVEAFKLIEGKLSGTTVKTEFGGFDGYFDKLSTQIAGGNAPHLVQMNFDPQLPEFAGRNALTDLTGYVGGKLDLSGLSPADQEGGKVGGKVYGVSLGTLVPATIVDTTAVDKLKLTAPTSWTWEQYAAFADEVRTASKGTVAGTEDCSAYDHVLNVWLLHRGRPGIFGPDGSVAATEADVAEWFAYWQALRKSGGCVPIQVQAAHNNGDHPTNPVVTGKAAMGLQFNTTRGVWSGITKNTLEFAALPDGDAPGNYARPSALWSVPTGTRNIDTAIEAINLFINDPQVAKALGFTRAVPNTKAVQAIGADLTPADKSLLDYTTGVLGKELAPAPRAPKGAGNIGKVLKTAAEEVAFGRTSVAEGARKFLQEAQGMAA